MSAQWLKNGLRGGDICRQYCPSAYWHLIRVVSQLHISIINLNITHLIFRDSHNIIVPQSDKHALGWHIDAPSDGKLLIVSFMSIVAVDRAKKRVRQDGHITFLGGDNAVGFTGLLRAIEKEASASDATPLWEFLDGYVVFCARWLRVTSSPTRRKASCKHVALVSRVH